MEILAILEARLHLAQSLLRDLIEHCESMPDAARGEKSSLLLDEVRTYLQIEENLLLPIMQKKGEDADKASMEQARAVHREIDDVVEHAVMMHVDEPHGEYYATLSRLVPLLERTAEIDREVVFPWARAHLTLEDQYLIATRLNSQILHESLY